MGRTQVYVYDTPSIWFVKANHLSNIARGFFAVVPCHGMEDLLINLFFSKKLL